MFFTSNKDFILMEIQANHIKFEKNKTNDNYDIVLKDGDSDVRLVKK
jgi:hypothetical protein